MNILMLCGEIPFPPHGGSRMREYQFIRALSARHKITLLAYQYEGDEHANIEELKKLCRVEAVQLTEPQAFAQMRSDNPLTARLAHWRALLFDRDPFVAQYFRAQDMTARLGELLARESFDVIHVEDTAMMALLPEQVKLPIVLSIQNVEYWREMRAEHKSIAEKIELAKLKNYERHAFERAAVCCPTSALEAKQVENLFPRARVQVIANGVDTQEFSPGDTKVSQRTLVFSGTLSYTPNTDGILWFAYDVLPLIRAEIPDVCLTVVGREPPNEIYALANSHVQVEGDVPDVRPYLRDASISIVPIREGGGTRLKILEAMACALPVVATSIGAEGLAVAHEKNILIADNPSTFTRETIRLLRDPALRQLLGQAGRALVVQNYDWRFITDLLEQVYSNVTRNT